MTPGTEELEHDWKTSERWAGILRPYGGGKVDRLRGTIRVRHTLAELGSEKLWRLLNSNSYVAALGALTGNQAIQQVGAGLRAIYVSGWQVAADGNDAGQMYPDLSLYPADSVPNVVRRINNALRREDEKQHMAGKDDIHWFAPIVADAEAGFGGSLHAFEITKAMIEAGAAGVHFEDQLAAAKKCGHLGGKVVVPTGEFIQKLVAARLASDVMGVPTVLVARTDANSARLVLLFVFQLAEKTGCVGDCDLPVRARPHGIPLPVRHARGFPHAELVHVRACDGLQRPRDVSVRRAAGSRDGGPRPRVSRNRAPGVRRHGVLR